MHALCPEAASVPFLQMRNLRVCGVEAAVFRISFTGEAGYELRVWKCLGSVRLPRRGDLPLG